MAGISQLTNLSQQQYSQGISGEQSMRQTYSPVFQADTSKAEALAGDITKLVKGIENYRQVKHDLSIDATEEMARDHLLNTKETIEATMANKELTYDQKRIAISGVAQQSIESSASFIKDDPELQKVYDKMYTDTMRGILSRSMSQIDIEEDEYNLNIKNNAGKDYLSIAPEEATLDGLKSIYKEHLRRGLVSEEDLKNSLIESKFNKIKDRFNANMNSVNDKYIDNVFKEFKDTDEVKGFKNKLYKIRKEENDRIINEREKSFMSNVYEKYTQDPSVENKSTLIKEVRSSKIKGDRKVTLLNMLGAFNQKTVSSSDLKKAINVNLDALSIKKNTPIEKQVAIAKNNTSVIEQINKFKEVINNSDDESFKKEMSIKLDNFIDEKEELASIMEAESNNSILYSREGSEGRAYINGKIEYMENKLMEAITNNDDKSVNDHVAALIRYTDKAISVDSSKLKSIDGRFLNAASSFNTKEDAYTFTVIANAVSNSGVQTLHKSLNDKQLINKLNSLDKNSDDYLDRFNKIRTQWQVANSKIVVRGDDGDVRASDIIDKVSDDLWTRLDINIPIGYSKKILAKEITKRGVENPLSEDEAVDLLADSYVTYSGDIKPESDDTWIGRNVAELGSSIWNTFTDTSIALPKGLGGQTDETIINGIFTGFLLNNKLSPYDVRVEVYEGSDGLPEVWVVNKESGLEIGTINGKNYTKYYADFHDWKKGLYKEKGE